MPKNLTTLQSLVDRVRQRADMTGSAFVSDAEVISYINVAMSEIHDVLVTKFEDYYVSSTTYTLPAANPGNLPDSFYKALGVDLDVGGITYRLKPYSFQERAMYNSPGMVASMITNTLYNIQGSLIKFIPSPTVSGSATLYYVPEAQQFSTSESEYMAKTVFDKAPAVAYGYEEYVVIDAAIKCLQKEESDVQVLLVQKQQQLERIEQAAGKRDAGESYAIGDVNVGTSSYLDAAINLV
tara:strand:+ start:344 stop:1060 length:717 start_codon:yes stop_codon:yes gene_type:complete